MRGELQWKGLKPEFIINEVIYIDNDMTIDIIYEIINIE